MVYNWRPLFGLFLNEHFFNCILVYLEYPRVRSNESTKLKNPEEKFQEDWKNINIDSEYIEESDYKEDVKDQIVEKWEIKSEYTEVSDFKEDVKEQIGGEWNWKEYTEVSDFKEKVKDQIGEEWNWKKYTEESDIKEDVKEQIGEEWNWKKYTEVSHIKEDVKEQIADECKIKSEYTEATDFKEEVEDLIVDNLKSIVKKEPEEEITGEIIYSRECSPKMKGGIGLRRKISAFDRY